jgi:flagellar hook-associated protein 2
MGVLGGGISINGPSGIDTASLVDQLVALEQQKVTTVQNKVTAYKTQISAYGKLQTTLSTIQTAAKDLNSASSFDLFKANSTNSAIVTLKGGAGAMEGNYDIQVAQLASNEKMISGNGLITSQTTSLTSQGITVGDMSVDGVTITIGLNDTIQDVRMKINSATKTDGSKLNVSASVLQVASNNFRLVLTSKTTGSTGIAYRDVSGSTLQGLGIINGVTGNATQVVTSQNPILAAFNALKTGATIQYSGTNHSGAAVTGTFTKTASNTSVDDFLAQLQTSFGNVAATVNGTGNLVLTDTAGGASQLGLTSATMTDSPAMAPVSDTFVTSVTGDVGVAQVITSQNPIADDFNNLKAGATIQYSGTTNDGTIVTNTYTKATATTSINDFLAQIQSDFGNSVASIDSGNNLVVTDSQTGVSQLAITAFSMTDTAAQAPATYTAAVTATGADGQGNKGNIAQTLTSADNIQNVFTALATGSTITYAGTDHNGNAISDSFTKTAASTIADFVAQIQQSFVGTVDVSVNGGNLVIADKTAGSSRLSLTTLIATDAATSVATSYAMNKTAGKTGAGVMWVGRDAYYSLDGLTLASSDNSVENVISGTIIELHKASVGETVQTDLTRDADAIKAKIQKLADAYNGLQTFVTDETKMADPTDSTSKGGDLAGDTTLRDILSRVRQQFMKPSAFSGDLYNSLTMIGIKTDPSTGQMSIDDKQFNKAITGNFDEVEHLFVTSGTGTNSNIILGRKTSDTQSGTYNLRETDGSGAFDTNFLSLQLAGNAANPWYTSNIRNGDIVTFASGPTNGLSLTSPAGTIGSGNTASYTLSIGMGDGISDLIGKMIDPGTGIIIQHENSINDQIKDTNNRADQLQNRVNDYHDRLVKQFAAMEQALQTMKNQAANMMSALGTTTTSS